MSLWYVFFFFFFFLGCSGSLKPTLRDFLTWFGCFDLVYNICLMATIPFEVASISQHKSTDRMQPLFCVGIHDIDHMSTLRSGYVACKLILPEAVPAV